MLTRDFGYRDSGEKTTTLEMVSMRNFYLLTENVLSDRVVCLLLDGMVENAETLESFLSAGGSEH